jgi:hypothetical protein
VLMRLAMKSTHLLAIAFVSSVVSGCGSSPVTGDEQFDTELEARFESCRFDPELGEANPF